MTRCGAGSAAGPLLHQPAPSFSVLNDTNLPYSGPEVIKPVFDLGETEEKKSQISADSGVSLASASQVCESLPENSRD